MKTFYFFAALVLFGAGLIRGQDSVAPEQPPAQSDAPPAQPADEGPGRLIENGDFEEGPAESGAPPTGWTFTTPSGEKVSGGITKIAAHSGLCSVIMTSPTVATIRTQELSIESPVQPGTAYRFSAWVKSHPEHPLAGGARGFISIQWKDEAGKEIKRTAGDGWTLDQLASGDWIQFKVEGQAPANTKTARFIITYALNPTHASGGPFLVDDADIQVVAPGAP